MVTVHSAIVPRWVSARLSRAEFQRSKRLFWEEGWGGVVVVLKLSCSLVIMVDGGWVLAGFCFERAGEASEVEGFRNAEIDIQKAETADGAAKVRVEPEEAPLRAEVCEVIGLPVIAPGEEEQKEPDFKTEDDIEHAGKFVIPAVFGHREFS